VADTQERHVKPENNVEHPGRRRLQSRFLVLQRQSHVVVEEEFCLQFLDDDRSVYHDTTISELEISQFRNRVLNNMGHTFCVRKELQGALGVT
jgi:hypothetical protein